MGSVYKRKNRQGKPLRNYSISYRDHRNKIVVESAGTSDKRSDERILRQREDEAALLRSGVVDPLQERYKKEAEKPISAHLEDYLAHCRDHSQASHGLNQKKRHLDWLLEATGAIRLTSLLPDEVDRHLGMLTEQGRSARTVNLRIEAAKAFLNWCVRNGRLRTNPLANLRKRNEIMDRRRERRALTADECRRLLARAREQAALRRVAMLRPLWYLLPLRAGLRRSDNESLTWGAVDLDQRVLTIRGGKARRRVDRLPLCADLVDEFRRVWPRTVLPSAPVFPHCVSNATRIKDFKKAGIVLVDEHGRHADLHSLRVTFGTELALQGVPPAVHQQLMRHSTIELTMRYYTKLGLDDLDKRGIDLLPRIEEQALEHRSAL